MTVRDGADIEWNALVARREQKRVGTRVLFAGNLTRQPAFRSVDYRVHGTLLETDKIMRDSFWIGVWTGISEPMLDYMADTFRAVTRELKDA
jgi:CDP-6-deoxy-D-xylo-4-hexulose-3-dehydrase